MSSWSPSQSLSPRRGPGPRRRPGSTIDRGEQYIPFATVGQIPYDAVSLPLPFSSLPPIHLPTVFTAEPLHDTSAGLQRVDGNFERAALRRRSIYALEEDAEELKRINDRAREDERRYACTHLEPKDALGRRSPLETHISGIAYTGG